MSKETEEEAEGTTISTKDMVVFGILAVLLAAVLGNVYLTINLNNAVIKQQGMMAGLAALPSVSSNSSNTTGNATTANVNSDTVIAETIAEIMPKGVPKVYGSELNINFDKAAEAIPTLSNIDKTVTFSGAENQRYVKIASQTSCEFCCGATSLVFQDGQAACACEHSYAMRGVIKYLIKNHADMSDDAILAEAVNWKVVFFPKEMVAKALEAKASNGQISSDVLGDLPAQVGGC